MDNANNSIFLYVFIINLYSWFIIWKDKRKAIKQIRRIPEKQLWLLAWLGGATGIYVGMRMFHHKTRKPIFKWGIPFLIIYNVTLFVLINTYLS